MSNLLTTRSHTDIVHKAIPYSGLENYILSTPPLLRLQRISQNSLVYLTFVTNKVKRFEHSLGVMHLAGNLFYSAIANTKVNILGKMLNKFGDELEQWAKLATTREKARAYGCSEYNLKGKNAPIVGLYNTHTPPSIPPKWSMLYASLYQGVRIAGLLHDIGHLPYSHTLETILGIIENRWKVLKKKSVNQRKYIKLFNTYKKDEKSFKYLHEAISKQLFPVVEGDCIKLVKQELNNLVKQKIINKKEENNYLVFCFYSFGIARKILDNTDNNSVIYKVLNKIISGTLDADRLDYVSRDLLCSGVSTDIINYGRIFTFLSFEENKNNSNPFPITIPAKTLGDVEEFLRKRWKIYRDINYHHSVHKSEMLMRSILIKSAETSHGIAASKSSKMKGGKRDLPNDFLQGIIYVLDSLEKNWGDENISETILQLDDSWLDTVMKKFENKNEMVSDLIYGEKGNYQTIIKRFDDFFEIDKRVYNLFKNDKVQRIFSTLDKELDVFYNFDKKLEMFYSPDVVVGIKARIIYLLDALVWVQEPSDKNSNHANFVFRDTNFFINRIIDSLNYYHESTDMSSNYYSYKEYFLKQLDDEAGKEFPEIGGVPTIMFGDISFDDGIKEDYMVLANNSFNSIKSYSALGSYLYTESLLLSPFHVYCKIEVDKDKVIEKLTEIIFRILKINIIKFAEELITKIESFTNSKGR